MNVNNSPIPPSGIGDLYHKSDLAGSESTRESTNELGADGVNGARPAAKAAAAAAGATGSTGASAGNDDVHLSELVRTLRSLAADSPERQARIEQLARSYVSGNYHVDAQATADGIISDSVGTGRIAASAG
jgi:flagellar biosynthesis anti-sigma factor FlgM